MVGDVSMRDYEPIELNAFFRATHSTIWELADKSGVLGQLGMTLKRLEFCESSKKAEAALLGGDVDFVAGNHITPYLWVALGKPMVCLASPGNTVRDRVITRQPVSSLAELKGKTLRVADSNLLDPWGGYHHPRGNHILDIQHAGFDDEEVDWVEVGELHAPEFPGQVVDALISGRADVGFAGGSRADFEREGLHVLDLPTLPMVNGPTITTSYEALNRKDRLAERLVRALVMAIHYARAHTEESQRLLDARMGRPYQEHGGRADGMARLPMKPYPTNDAVSNAYELCAIHYPETREVSSLALWDLHYLRDLDLSGFIDELIQEQPESARQLGRDRAGL